MVACVRCGASQTVGRETPLLAPLLPGVQSTVYGML